MVSCNEVFALRQRLNPHYRFIGWFAEAWHQAGGAIRPDLRINGKIRAVLGRLLGFPTGFAKRKMLVCGSSRIESRAWPWIYFYEVIPVMWDLWPAHYRAFARFVRRNGCKKVFCTAKQSVEWLKAEFPDREVWWVPEAIDVATFPCGGELKGRPVDVLCYGRILSLDRLDVDKLSRERGLVCKKWKGATIEELSEELRAAKVSVCYPRCDTEPAKAQGVETLTQRYWEAMCSGTLLVGRAPKELEEVCGYNPVIELGDKPEETLVSVIEHIADFQVLADRNRRCAERIGDWSTRIQIVRCALSERIEGGRV